MADLIQFEKAGSKIVVQRLRLSDGVGVTVFFDWVFAPFTMDVSTEYSVPRTQYDVTSEYQNITSSRVQQSHHYLVNRTE